MKIFNIGDVAPTFEGPNQNGEIIKSSDYAGKKIVLYFYPKDNTPGCTAESCNLSDNYTELQKQGFIVIGVSADSEKSHVKFIDKYNLPFDLIADTEKIIINNFGCWGPKKFMGKEYEGIHRKTFIIGEDGKFLQIFEKVKTKTHTDQILTSL
ncbi:MAG: peroxiredoxin Q/BCP [Flavobacteriales bacterium]|jgi:peroxiredoxin Q/BCP